MTSPRAERLLLILWVSLSRAPSAPDLLTRSEPAKSTRFSLPAKYRRPIISQSVGQSVSRSASYSAIHSPNVLAPVVLFTPVTCTQRRACDRDECSFIFVLAVERFLWPSVNAVLTSATLCTATQNKPETEGEMNSLCTRKHIEDQTNWIQERRNSKTATIYTSLPYHAPQINHHHSEPFWKRGLLCLRKLTKPEACS